MEIQSIKNRFGIIGNSPALNYALQVAVQVAPTDLTVLINGESGVGKEVFSKIIDAVIYLKSQGIVHADLTPESVVLTDKLDRSQAIVDLSWVVGNTCETILDGNHRKPFLTDGIHQPLRRATLRTSVPATTVNMDHGWRGLVRVC